MTHGGPCRFERERALLEQAIGPWVVGGIHRRQHRGIRAAARITSTSFPATRPAIETLAFRDHLRASPEKARDYAELKHRLAARFEGDREAYTDAKADFIARALAEVELSWTLIHSRNAWKCR